MELDPEVCYRALRTRDARFDGRFFTAVRSTGVYCRPICPAPTPRRENCLFVACAAAAQEAGYRPCLRCRPEAAPGTPAWRGTSATVSRALRLIDAGALDAGSVAQLAERLGIGERHLRRLFHRHLGASPVALAQTRRLLFAKRLLDETALPVTEVALAAGFSSLRRFHHAIHAAYGRAPSALRGRAAARDPDAGSEIALHLPFRSPLHWPALAAFLAGRATPGVEYVTPEGYRRTIAIGGARGVVEVRPVAGERHLLARIRVSSPAPLMRIAERLRGLFDLGADPCEIAAHLSRDPRLRRAVRAYPGLRVPGAWDGFELAVRAVLGQQVSVRAASTLAGRLAEAWGEPLATGNGGAERGELRLLFPTPEALAGADLARIGLPRTRAEALAALAAAVVDGKLALDGSRDLDAALDALRDLPGIGEWTAQYVAMRALGAPDAFPEGDLGLRRALGCAGRPARPAELRAAGEPWRPWRAYAAMYLWTAAGAGAFPLGAERVGD